MLKGTPHDPVVHNELGLAYVDYGNMFLADTLYKKALSLAPNYAEAHFNLAMLYKEVGSSMNDSNKLKGAREHFELSVKFAQNEEIIDKGRKYIEEIDLKIKSIETPEETEEITAKIQDIKMEELPLINKMEEEKIQEEIKATEVPEVLEERITYYKDRLKSSPSDPLIYNELGRAYFEYGNVFLADSHYRKALELNSSYGEAHFNIALLYKELGTSLKEINKLKDALEHFKVSEKCSQNEEIITKARNNIELLEKQIRSIEDAEKGEEVSSDLKILKEKEAEKVIEPVKAEEIPEKEEPQTIEYYQELLKTSPDDPLIYTRLGLLYYEKKKPNKAKEHYEKALKLDPNFAEAHMNLGLLYKDKKNVLKTLRHFKLCVKTSKDDSLIKKAREYIKEIEDLGASVMETPFETKEIKLEEAKVIDESPLLRELKSSLEKSPDDLEANINIAVLYKESGDMERAIEHYIKCLSIKPSDAKLCLEVALLYKEQGKFNEALDYLRICARKADNSELLDEAKNYINQIEMLSSEELAGVKEKVPELVEEKKEVKIEEVKILEKSKEEELKEYEIKLKDEPDNQDVRLQVARLYGEFEKFDKSISHYKYYLKINSKDFIAHLEIGQVYRNVGNVFNALKHFRRCIKLTKDEDLKTKVEMYISEIEGMSPDDIAKKETDIKGKEGKNLIEKLTKELKEKPDDVDLLNRLGEAYYSSGSHKLSCDCYLKVLEIEPMKARTHFNIGLIYREQKKVLKALIHFKKYMSLDPQGEYLTEARHYIEELE
ncbi:MAG: photosystem I assembly protein Ycf3 [bacterium ADurb.Bin363]|nr:MAG: photosystem I assembly protein Ycf3 [bacterium ADurb.Bin363]